MTTPLHRTWPLVILAIVSVAALEAQPSRSIADDVRCAPCRIVLRRVVDVGHPSDSILLSTSTRFALLGQGRVLAGPTTTPGVLAVFDAGNGALRRTFGRRGTGPGEFGFPSDFAVADSRIFVFDRELSRVTVLGASLDVERTIPVPARLIDSDGFLALGQRLIISSMYGSRARPGPIWIVTHDGSVAATAGMDESQTAGSFARQRFLGAAGPDRFWVARLTSYELELWDTTGVLRRTLDRHASWFPPWQTLHHSPVREAPPPHIAGIHVASDGLLWITIWVADANWKALPQGQQASDEIMNRFFDTRLEVLDPDAGTLLASHQFPDLLVPVRGSDLHLASFRSDPSGVVVWTLYRPAMNGRDVPK